MKIAFIGAGSLGFTSELVRDILTFDLLRDATLALMDIDDERLFFAQNSVKKNSGGREISGKGDCDKGQEKGPEGCRCCPDDDPVRKH